MAKEKKTTEVKAPSKKSNKNIIILIVLLVICSVAAFLLFEKKPPEIKETVDVGAVSDSLFLEEINIDSSMLMIDSILTVDTIQPENIVKAEPQKKKVIRKVSKVQMDNNPKYWMVVKGSNEDTTFYNLKNRKTGTKLSNKYFSKEKAEEELDNFRNIISN